MIIVYEYMCNGCLDKWNFDQNNSEWSKLYLKCVMCLTGCAAYKHTQSGICVATSKIKILAYIHMKEHIYEI